MQRICVFGPTVVLDEVVGDQSIITRAETWEIFRKGIPTKGSCKLFVGYPGANGDNRRINGKHLKEYTFDQVCKRVERELAPKAG